MKKYVILTIIGIILTISALILLYNGDRALVGGEAVTVRPLANPELAATYYAGTQPAGVLLLEGFGSDQMAMHTAASEFAQAGVHVLTLDFSGHGRSPGTIGFDNAATAVLANQALAGLDTFSTQSGLAPEQIIIMGHSMGARVGLQAMTLTDEPVAGLVLLGAQVNLDSNQQAETFTGTSDSDLLWVKSLGAEIPATDILLVTGSWDDILPPASAELLIAKLQGDGSANWARDLVVLDNLVHNYEIYSPRVMSLAKSWAGEQLGMTLEAEAQTAQNRLLLWLLGMAGIFLAVFGGWRWAANKWPVPEMTFTMRLQRPSRFLIAKLLLWLAAIPFAILLGGLFFLAPLGLPAFNLYYVCFIGGYGLLLLLLYWRGWVPGIEGRLEIGDWRLENRTQSPISNLRLVLVLVITLALLLVVTLFIQTGLFFAPSGQRLIWLLIYTPFTALGFGIGLREFQLLSQADVGKGTLVATAVIGLFPFILYTIFLAALGSTSGMLGGLQGLIILALVWLTGGLVYQIGQRVWLTAVIQAILLYWLVLPVGPLFAM